MTGLETQGRNSCARTLDRGWGGFPDKKGRLRCKKETRTLALLLLGLTQIVRPTWMCGYRSENPGLLVMNCPCAE